MTSGGSPSSPRSPSSASADETGLTERVESVPNWIRSVLENRIVSGALAPGDRIGLKSTLLEEFGVSGPSLDQALKLLQNDGLIVLRRGPNGGVFVARSEPVLRLGSKRVWARNASSLQENMELRESLGALLGVTAARNRRESKPDLIAELADIAEALREAPIAWETQQLIFRGHRILVELSDNETLRVIYLSLLDAAQDVIIKVDFPTTGVEASRERRRIEAHRNLFNAVVDGDVEMAHQYGDIVRVVSPLGRDGHQVTVGSSQPKPLRAVTDRTTS